MQPIRRPLQVNSGIQWLRGTKVIDLSAFRHRLGDAAQRFTLDTFTTDSPPARRRTEATLRQMGNRAGDAR